MMLKGSFFFLLLVLIFYCSCMSPTLEKRLEKHVNYLASDDLCGRETGTLYEKMSAAYIQNEFIKIGLEPKGENGTFYQDFEFLNGRSLSLNNQLIIDGHKLEIGKNYLPLSFSANGLIKGNLIKKIIGRDEQESEIHPEQNIYENNESVYLIDLEKSVFDHNIHDFEYQYMYKLASQLSKQGVAAIVFYSDDTSLINIKENSQNLLPILKIPVLFLKKFQVINQKEIFDIHLKVDYIEDKRIGRNVIGFIDNGKKKTVVIAGHHDGLGEVTITDSNGEDKSLIYNGADDGISGISALIEFSRYVKSNNLRNHNYVFISFSGEEKGLFGSYYFTHNPSINLKEIYCMISIDHIGRMDQSGNDFTLYGTGTSPDWSLILT
jgi:Peptidase family M28